MKDTTFTIRMSSKLKTKCYEKKDNRTLASWIENIIKHKIMEEEWRTSSQ